MKGHLCRDAATPYAVGRSSLFRRTQDRAHGALGAWFLVASALLLLLPQPAPAQPSGGPTAPCMGASEAIAVSAAPQMPQALFEVPLVLQNRTEGTLHVDPARMALLSDRGEQAGPLTAEQAKAIIYNPGQSLWAGFWFGILGYTANRAKQARLMKEVDLRILTATDLQPGAVQKGSLFFKAPDPKADQFVLVVDGLSAASGALPPVRVACAYPKNRPGGATASVPAVRAYALQERATSGPIAVTVSQIEFSQDATTLSVTFENDSDAEADLFFAKAGATLTDGAGRTYALRALTADVGDRVAAHGTLQGRLMFAPLPVPPATSAAVLTMPDVHVGDAAYDLRIELHL